MIFAFHMQKLRIDFISLNLRKNHCNEVERPNQKKTFRRRHERILRVLKVILIELFENKTALVKNSKLTEQQHTKWLTVVKNEFMSSEESDENDDTIVVHPLPWRSEHINKMFCKIDAYCYHKKSPQAKRQTKKGRWAVLQAV